MSSNVSGLAVPCRGVAVNSAMPRACALSPTTDETLLGRMKEATELKAAIDEHAIVAITDRQGQITSANDKFCAVSKYSREGLLRQDHRILNSCHQSRSFFLQIWKTIEKVGVWHGEIKHRAKDGSSYWVATTVVPLLDEQKEMRQFLSIGSDITDQKRVESELTEVLRLQRLVADLSTRFIAGAARERGCGHRGEASA